jgi:hypothetical protein
MSACRRLFGRTVIVAVLAVMGLLAMPAIAERIPQASGQEGPKEARHKARLTSEKTDGVEPKTRERTQPVLQEDLEALLRIGEDESKQLAAIREELREQGEERPKSYLDRLEHVLDSSLAGTLAGLALAAATFVITFTVPVAERIKRVRSDGGTPGPTDKKTLEKMQTAVKQLMASFYVFVGFLVESLTLDQWAKPGAWLAKYAWAEPADVFFAGGGLVLGIVLLGLGAKTLKSIVIEPDTQDLS